MIKKSLCFLIFSFSVLIASEPSITIVNHTYNSFKVEITFPSVDIRMVDEGPGKYQKTYITMPGLPQLSEQNFPQVPYFSKMFSLPANTVSYRVVRVERESIPVNHYVINTSFDDPNDLTPIVNKELVVVSKQGLFRDSPLFNLLVFPVRLNSSGSEAEIIKSILIEIFATGTDKNLPIISAQLNSRDKSLLTKLLINGDYVNYKIAQPLYKIAVQSQKYKSGRYKILIDRTGLYHISYNDLLIAEVPVSQYDTRNIRIINKGNEIPIYFKGGEDGSFDSGDYFEFWAEKNEKGFLDKYPDVYHDPYSDINVYWMEESGSSGLRMAEESGALLKTIQNQYVVPFAFKETLHFEEDNSFIRFGSANTDSLGHTIDHWFYDRGITAIGSKTYDIFIPWPEPDLPTRTVFTKAMMRGLSIYNRQSNPLENHQAEIWLNDQYIASSGEWIDQDREVITNIGGTGLSQTALHHGNNQFRVVMDQSGVTDIALLNWFDISYQRLYRAHQNEVRFRKQDNLPDGFTVQFEVDGFTRQDIEVYKLGISKIVNNRRDYITAGDEHSSYRVSFQDDIYYPDIEYVAITPDRKKKPLKIIKDEPWIPEQEESSLLDITTGADYLVITHELFYDKAQELKTYRENFGLTVEVVKVEDIYDEFNYGIKSPLAIVEFLKYAYRNWDPNHRLLYVNLMGDASYNYKSTATDFVPTFLFETEKYGAASSDHQYALVSGNDDTPDLIIGRWPVSSVSEFEAYFNKLKDYESPSNIGEWRNRGLFISGNDVSTIEHYTGLPAFRAQNQRLINFKAPDGYFTRKLNTIEDTSIPGGDPNFGGSPTLIDYWDEGLSLINFFGHGGGGVWADVGLFNTQDIERLNNGSRLPFVKSMTCFTGAFESGSLNGIAEELIVTPEKGAIGVYAASGVGWLHNDFAVGWTMTDLLLQHDLTVGEAILYTKIFYLNNNLYVTEEFDTVIPDYYNLKRSMVNHYNLLGDPFVNISSPDPVLVVTTDNSIPSVGDTISILINAPFSSGNGRIELTNEKNEPLEETFLSFNDYTAQAEFVVSQDLQNQYAYLKAYAISSSGNQDGSGSATIAVNKAILDSLVIMPSNPQVEQELTFSAYITSPIDIESVRIKNLRGPVGRFHTFNLIQMNDSVWTSAEAFGPYLFSDTIFFDVQIYDTAGASYLSRRHELTIMDPRPDLRITQNSFSFGGKEQIELLISIENRSDTTFTDINVHFYTDSIGSGQIPFHTGILNINPYENKTMTVSADPSLLSAERKFLAVIDPLNDIEERSEDNNFASVHFPNNLFNIPQEIGTTYNGITNDTLVIDPLARFNLPAQGLSASSVFRYRIEEDDNLNEMQLQPGFQYVNFNGRTNPASLSINFENPAANQLISAFLEFTVDTSMYEQSYLSDVSICRLIPSLNRWVAINSPLYHNKISATIMHEGNYALFRIQDSKDPVVEITVNGRLLHNDMLVPENPTLAFILQDENGVDISSGFRVYIDDQQLSESDLNIPDSVQNANAISLVTKPSLSVGSHNLRVELTDAYGNTSTKIVDFKVAGGFDIQIYGNYPNPFDDFTIFSFSIIATDVLEKFSIKIYTVAGRQIREINRPQGSDEIWDPGYHEIEWDGRDKDGSPVANGVYFALVAATYQGKSLERKLKVAKLR